MFFVDILRRKRLFNSWIYLTLIICILVEAGSRYFVELKVKLLKKIQDRSDKVLVVIINDYSMVFRPAGIN